MKKLLHLMALAAAAIVVIGCSGGSAEDASKTPPKGAEATGETPGAAAPATE